MHVVIDQFSKFPVVEIVQSTGWEQLKRKLDDMIACHGVPEQLTTDGGPPYNSHQFELYSKRMGFKHHITTPEDAQANGFAEAFVKVLCKLVHTAVAEGRDPKKALNSYLMAYRATPHRTTGVSPAELLFGRKIQTRLPQRAKKAEGKVVDEARKNHEERRHKQKQYADKKRKAQDKDINPGDKVMIQQRKTNTKPPWDPKPYTVTETRGAQVKVKRDGVERLRAKNHVKPIKERPEYLRKRVQENQNLDRASQGEPEVYTKEELGRQEIRDTIGGTADVQEIFDQEEEHMQQEETEREQEDDGRTYWDCDSDEDGLQILFEGYAGDERENMQEAGGEENQVLQEQQQPGEEENQDLQDKKTRAGRTSRAPKSFGEEMDKNLSPRARRRKFYGKKKG